MTLLWRSTDDYPEVGKRVWWFGLSIVHLMMSHDPRRQGVHGRWWRNRRPPDYRPRTTWGVHLSVGAWAIQLGAI